MIGSVGYTMTGAQSADSGWFLLPVYWGQGYAAQAVSAMLGEAFGSGRVARMSASVARDNPRSLRVAEKCGFRQIKATPSRVYLEAVVNDFL